MKPVHLMRQLDIIPIETLGQKITVIGAGAIGSWVVLSLAKMGFSDITVYDHDEISEENMNCQFYPMHNIGYAKCDALYRLVHSFTNIEINSLIKKYEGGPFQGVVVAAVDSMLVRKLIWENAKQSPMCRYVIDPRMGAEEALMYCMNPNDPKDIASYEKTLYSDEAAEQERCTAKATIYTANMLSGLVAKTVKDIVTGGKRARTVNWSIKSNEFLAWS